MSIEAARPVCKAGTHATGFTRGRWRNMIIMAKSQTKGENKAGGNMEVAQSESYLPLRNNLLRRMNNIDFYQQIAFFIRS